MLRSTVLAVLQPLCRASRPICILQAKHPLRLSYQNMQRLPRHCRCLTTSHRAYTQSGVADSAEPSTAGSTPLTSDEVKRQLLRLPPADQELFAKSELDNLSGDELKKLRMLEMEYDVWMSTGCKVPEEMTSVMWLQIYHTASSAGRNKLYSFWFKREKKALGDERKKREKKERHLQRQAENQLRLEEEARKQGLKEGQKPQKNTIFFFIRPNTMLQHCYNNMAWAMQYGQPIVIDLGLESHMKNRECSSLIKQVIDLYAVNKVKNEPFHLVMAGLDPEGFIYSRLTTSINNETVPMTVTTQSYMDLYDHDRLVYLTPDSPNELTHWNPHDVYIVGGLVDLSVEKPITFAKARRQNIRTARLPLDRYMMWQQGSKAMTLDCMMKVLCEAKDTGGDWVKAFSHIPKRKAQIRPQVLHNTQDWPTKKNHQRQPRFNTHNKNTYRGAKAKWR